MSTSLYQHLKNNYSFLRFLEHERVKEINISGDVIDLGAKSIAAPYYAFLPHSGDMNVIFCDIKPKVDNVQQVNLEKPLQIASDQFDHVLLFNVLEHVYNYQNLIEEIYRVLRSGGTAHVMAPFLWPYHGDPADFNRLTHVALYRLFVDQGFNQVKIYPIGMGAWTLIGSVLSSKIKPLWPKYVVLRFCIWMQNLENRIVGQKTNFSLAYYVEAQK